MNANRARAIISALASDIDAIAAHPYAGNRRDIAIGTLELVTELAHLIGDGDNHAHQPAWPPKVLSIPNTGHLYCAQQCACGAMRQVHLALADDSASTVGEWVGGSS